MKRAICIFLATLALTSIGCEDTAKKAEEAAKATAASASAAAAKASAEVAEKAKEAAKAAVDSQKGGMKKKITDGIALLDQKVTDLKSKAAKLPAVKVKADEAFKKYDAAKTALTAMTGSVDGISDMAGITEMGSKITSGLGDATKAVEAIEGVVAAKK
jgi:hypothetical protein